MNPVRGYRFIAFCNAGCGALLLLAVLAGAIAVVLAGEKKAMVLVGVLLAILAVVGVMLIQAARTHLRQPSRKSALRLAGNSGVILWFLLGGVLGLSGLGVAMTPLYTMVAIALAYLSHRFLLKPAALRAFPD